MDNRMSDSSFPMKIGNEEFKASMLTDRDHGDLDNFIKAKFIANAINAANLLDNEDEKQQIKSLALRQSCFVGWYTPERIGIMSTIDGMLHLGHQMIRKRHPKVTYLEFVEFASQDYKVALEQINLADKMLNYPNEESEGDGGSGGTSTENSKSE